MRMLALAAVGSLAFMQAAVAGQSGSSPEASNAVCNQSLAALTAEWDAAAYPAPSKPAQYRVYGAAGRAASAPDVAAMEREIRAAAQDCRNGDTAGAAQQIAAAQSLLDPSAHRDAADTAPSVAAAGPLPAHNGN